MCGFDLTVSKSVWQDAGPRTVSHAVLPEDPEVTHIHQVPLDLYALRWSLLVTTSSAAGRWKCADWLFVCCVLPVLMELEPRGPVSAAGMTAKFTLIWQVVTDWKSFLEPWRLAQPTWWMLHLCPVTKQNSLTLILTNIFSLFFPT